MYVETRQCSAKSINLMRRRKYVCMYVCMYMYVCMLVDVCMHVCMYTFVCMWVIVITPNTTYHHCVTLIDWSCRLWFHIHFVQNFKIGKNVDNLSHDSTLKWFRPKIYGLALIPVKTGLEASTQSYPPPPPGGFSSKKKKAQGSYISQNKPR